MEVGSNGGEDGEDDDEDDGSGGAGLTSWMQELHMSVANDDMASFKAILAKEDVRKDLEVTTKKSYIDRKKIAGNLLPVFKLCTPTYLTSGNSPKVYELLLEHRLI